MGSPLAPGQSQYQSQQTYALTEIDSTRYPDTNKDFQANMQRLNTWVDYIASYLQTMQKGIDAANQDSIQKVQGLVSNLEELFAGGDLLFGIDLGNLQYFLPAIGALLGFNGTEPFPINLFNAAEHFFLGYVVPLSSFSTTIDGLIVNLLTGLGVNANFIQSVTAIVDAFQNTINDVETFLSTVEQLLNIIGISSGDLSGFGSLWHALSLLLGGFSLDNLGSITNPIFLTLAPWFQTVAQGIDAINNLLEGINNLTGPIGTFLGNFQIFSGIFGWLNSTGTPFSGINEWFSIPGLDALSQELEQASANLADIVDLLFNGFSGSFANGVSLGALAKAVGTIVNKIETALSSVSELYGVVAQIAGMIQQLVQDLLNIPFFGGALNLLANFETAITSWWTNITNSLSGANPAIAAANTQITALWTKVAATGTSIKYNFDTNTALSGAWSTVTGYSFPTIVADTHDYVADNNAAAHFAVYSTPLTTANNYVSAVIEELVAYGSAQIFMCGNFAAGTLNQYVALEVNRQSYGDSLYLVTYTSARTGRTLRATASTPNWGYVALAPGDVIAIDYDQTSNTFAIIRNNQKVGQTWTDSGNVIAHTTGNLFVGVVTDSDAAGFGSSGCGLGEFVAYDVLAT